MQDLGRKERQTAKCALWCSSRRQLDHCPVAKLWETVQTTYLTINLPKEQGRWRFIHQFQRVFGWGLFLGTENSPELLACHSWTQSSFTWYWEMKPSGPGMQMLAVGRWRVWEIWVGTDGVRHRLPRLVPSSAFHTWLKPSQSHAFLDILELGNEEQSECQLSGYEAHYPSLFE